MLESAQPWLFGVIHKHNLNARHMPQPATSNSYLYSSAFLCINGIVTRETLPEQTPQPRHHTLDTTAPDSKKTTVASGRPGPSLSAPREASRPRLLSLPVKTGCKSTPNARAGQETWKPSSILRFSCRDRRWKGGKKWGIGIPNNGLSGPYQRNQSTTQFILTPLLAMHPVHLLISLFDFFIVSRFEICLIPLRSRTRLS
ncbi:hypothetical protein QBC32DRAFT_54415 [Pseudoneurospora amorphoporcata]|uniref:Uncharacterized protein n=1 Tax=Pseudoneurospora amorphoporcata TaxID=241081 RepID=A0AAN6NMG7_9PEZI|nr:hypothetical protein QBC32DRAFT_54415 [Pseudoneurospora amorphoporcata]